MSQKNYSKGRDQSASPSKYRSPVVATVGSTNRGWVRLGAFILLCVALLGGRFISFSRSADQTAPSTVQTPEVEGNAALAVVMAALSYDRLRLIGGTGHWFHLLERLLPLTVQLSQNVWSRGSQGGELFIVFQEKWSCEDLDGFSAFLLATVISGGLFDAVTIGYAGSVTISADGVQPLVVAHSFVASQRLELDPTRTRALRDVPLSTAPGNASLPRTRVFRELFHVSWDFAAKKKYNMVTLPAWELFHQAVNRSCPSADHSAAALPVSNEAALHDHLSEPPRRLAKKLYKWRNGTSFAPPRVVPQHLSLGPRVVIYQRDVSRRLLHARRLASKLELLLSDGGALSKKGAPAGNDSSNSSLRQQRRATWRVELLTHSSTRPPCDLVSALRSATVLITPHGFQSILLLFQPRHSLLVELHPALYFKPEVFGLVQAGLRHTLGSQRLYLAGQSQLRTWYMWLISAVMSLLPLRDAGFCTGNALCRYLARLQAVEMDESFLRSLSTFILKTFPLIH